MKLKPIETDIITAMLGRLHGTFEPINPFTVKTAGWAWQHRDAYLGRYHWTRNTGLLPRPTFGGDATAKKREQRGFDALEGLGLVRLQKKLAGLTDEGRHEAETITTHIHLEDALPGLDFILSKLGTDAEWIDRRLDGRLTAQGYFSEASLAGFDAMPKGTVGKNRCECVWVPDGLMPLLVSGLVEFDYQPHFELPLYRLTPEGEALAHKRKKSGTAKPGDWLKLKKTCGKCSKMDQYLDEWVRTTNEMKNARPLLPNVIQHQMNGFTWPRSIIDAPDDGED